MSEHYNVRAHRHHHYVGAESSYQVSLDAYYNFPLSSIQSPSLIEYNVNIQEFQYEEFQYEEYPGKKEVPVFHCLYLPTNLKGGKWKWEKENMKLNF